MARPLVVITDSNLPQEGIEERVPEPAGFRVERAACRTEQEVLDAAHGADALIVQWAPITEAILRRLPECKLVSRLGVGLLLTPHAAWYSAEALVELPMHAAENIVAFFSRGDEPLSLVNPDYALAGEVVRGATRQAQE